MADTRYDPHPDTSTCTENALYTKLLNVGLDDAMINEAVQHIQHSKLRPACTPSADCNAKPKRLVSNPCVIKAANLFKESKHLSKTRRRWMVLTGKFLRSYREQQDYSHPTEVFDLTLFRTARVCRDAHGRDLAQPQSASPAAAHAQSQRARFELISLKQEHRVFVAESRHEMNEWLRCIKRAMLFSRGFSNKCRSVRSCLSLRRLSHVLRLFAASHRSRRPCCSTSRRTSR